MNQSICKSLLGIALIGVCVTAEAGVKGGVFTGTLTNSQGQAFQNTESFATNGQLHYTTDYGFDQTGSYNDIDLGVISFWTGTVPQPGNPAATLYGLSFFSFATYAHVDNNVGVTAQGILIKSGSAPSQSTPGASVGTSSTRE